MERTDPQGLSPLNTRTPKSWLPQPPLLPRGSSPTLFPALPASCLLVYFLNLAPPGWPRGRVAGPSIKGPWKTRPPPSLARGGGRGWQGRGLGGGPAGGGKAPVQPAQHSTSAPIGIYGGRGGGAVVGRSNLAGV